MRSVSIALQLIESIRRTNPELIADNLPSDWGMNRLREELLAIPADADMATINLNVFDDDGNVVDGTTATLSHDQLSVIVDHASQAILLRREGKSFDAVLNDLDEALSSSDVIQKICDTPVGLDINSSVG